MIPVLAIAIADLRLLVRDRGALFFMLFFPLLLAVFFGAIFGGGGASSKLDVAVVNESSGEVAASFVKDLAADDSLNAITHWQNENAPATPLTRDQGMSLVRRGSVSACIVVPKEFDASLTGLFSGSAMKLEAIVAPGHAAEGGLLTGKLNELAFRQLSRVFTDTSKLTTALDDAKSKLPTWTGVTDDQRTLLKDMFDRIDDVNKSMPDRDTGTPTPGEAAGAPEGEKDAKAEPAATGLGGWRPVEVSLTELKSESNRPRSSWEISFPQGIVWALMGCVTGFGVSLNAERARGTMVRLSTAPITRRQILAGKALACFLACLAAQVLLILLAVGVFGAMFGKFSVGNPAMLAAALVLSALGFTGLMMLLAGLTRTEAAASGMGRGAIILLAMIGGGTVPLFFLPPWVQTVSNVSPFKWVTLAIEGSVWRGFSWGEFAFPALVLVGFALVGFVVGGAALAKGERN